MISWASVRRSWLKKKLAKTMFPPWFWRVFGATPALLFFSASQSRLKKIVFTNWLSLCHDIVHSLLTLNVKCSGHVGSRIGRVM